jgi:hypothetical protein
MFGFDDVVVYHPFQSVIVRFVVFQFCIVVAQNVAFRFLAVTVSWIVCILFCLSFRVRVVVQTCFV